MLFLGFILQALAHARLVESAPFDGAVLAAAPTRVTLRFDQEVEFALGKMVLQGVPPKDLVPIATNADPHTLAAALPALVPGTHRVTWRVVSRDGHPVEGELSFIVE